VAVTYFLCRRVLSLFSCELWAAVGQNSATDFARYTFEVAYSDHWSVSAVAIYRQSSTLVSYEK
jgi:hypothetical protein